MYIYVYAFVLMYMYACINDNAHWTLRQEEYVAR